MLIIFMVSTNVLLWTFSQNALYTQAEKDVNQEEGDRRNENVVATDGNYSVSTNEVTVEATLTNAGSVAAQIINLWVFATPIQTYNYTSLNLNLNPGNVTKLTGSNAILVTVEGADSADNFVSWFVTRRGNTIPLEEEQEQSVIAAEVAQGIGSIAMNFSTFRYFEYETSTKLANYSDGVKSFNVPGSGTPIAFGAVLTNLDPSKNTITFNNYSNIWLMFPGAPGQTPQWYVVNVASNGTIAPSYSPICLPYKETKLIVFASSKAVTGAGSFSRNSISPSITPNPCAVNLLLLGTIEPRDYGQNIPFVSLYVYKP